VLELYHKEELKKLIQGWKVYPENVCIRHLNSRKDRMTKGAAWLRWERFSYRGHRQHDT